MAAAVRLAARREGLLLDPVYSGKALAALLATAAAGRLAGTVVFLHTGGAATLPAYPDVFPGLPGGPGPGPSP
jgi:1-aminocyclopropane-1-carboxylate deaminase/D-cysteine desulfhydrase-like pyridoxal-dependent ACC family enzyme